MWMNEYDIAIARRRFRDHPVLGKATRFLSDFRDEVNAHSDGWPYWNAPARAANKLMTLIENAITAERSGKPVTITETQLTAAITPIKAFYTRKGNKAGMQFPPI